MTTVARAFEQRYAARVPKSPLQNLAGFWLDHAREEAELARRLVAAQFEEPAKLHAKAALSCVHGAVKALERRGGALQRGAKALEEYRLEMGPRAAYSESMLR